MKNFTPKLLLLVFVLTYAFGCKREWNSPWDELASDANKTMVISKPELQIAEYTTATIRASITKDLNFGVVERGICYGKAPKPTTENRAIASGTTGSFTVSLSNLTAETTYYIRAYASNEIGTVYSAEEVFQTKLPTIPVLTTAQAVDNV